MAEVVGKLRIEPETSQRMDYMTLRTAYLFLTAMALGHSPILMANDEAVWFVVAERSVEHGDSFLLPLRSPEHIADARAFLADPRSEVGRIAVANIAVGGDGFNRDVGKPDSPLWSWHVTELDGFQDLGMEICDGWPGYIEEDPARFVDNSDGVLCLWGYSIVAELEAPPSFRVGEGLDGAWYQPDTSGQGVFLDVLPGDPMLVGMGWFTWRIDGFDGQLWLSALGTVDGARTSMDLFATSGGKFNDPAPVDTHAVGTAELEFTDCNRATLHYDFLTGHTGEIPLVRVVPRPGCHVR